MPTVADLSILLKADTSQASSGLLGIAKMLGPGGLIAAGAIGAGAAVAGIAIAATKMAGNFQESMTQLVTGAGESKANLDLVSQGILSMATATGTSTQQLSAGMYMVESAGYHGAAGLKILQAAAEGAKVGNADLGTVADAVTTIMTDYSAKGETAAQATNALIATVSSGKVHMADLAGAMAQILPTASAAGVGLNDVMAAMATMTGEGVPAANAATYLRQTILALDAPSKQTKSALEAVGLSSSDVASEMQKSLPDALAMITDAVGKKFPVGSAQYVAALKDIAGGSKQMQGILDLTGTHMATFQGNLTGITGQVKAGGDAIQGWSDVQGDFNFKMSQLHEVFETVMIALGTHLLPIATQAASLFAGALTTGITFVQQHGQQLVPILIGLGAALAVTVVPVLLTAAGALAGLAGAAIVAAAPFIAIAAVIAGLVIAFQHAYASSMPFRQAVDQLRTSVGFLVALIGFELHQALQALLPVVQQVAQWLGAQLGQAARTLMPLLTSLMLGASQLADWLGGHLVPGLRILGAALGVVGTFVAPLVSTLRDQLLGVWHQLSATLNGQLGPALSQLGGLLRTLAPVFAAIAVVVGGVLVVALGVLVGVIQGVISGFGSLLSGVIQAVGGIVHAVTSMVSLVVDLITGAARVWQDIMAGNWRQMGIDASSSLHAMWADVQGIFQGIGAAIVGILKATVGTVFATLGGFVSGVIGFFQNLANVLVGHSIVPDMLNAIVSLFTSLPGRAVSALSSLIGDVGGVFSNLASQALTWGADFVSNIAAGIANAAGSVIGAAQNLAGHIAGFLHFSHPDLGPLADVERWMPDFGATLARGLTAQVPVVSGAAQQVAAAVAGPIMSGPSTSSSTVHNWGGITIVNPDPNAVVNQFRREARLRRI